MQKAETDGCQLDSALKPGFLSCGIILLTAYFPLVDWSVEHNFVEAVILQFVPLIQHATEVNN